MLKFSFHCTDCNKERPIKNGSCTYCGSIDVELIDSFDGSYKSPRREDYR